MTGATPFYQQIHSAKKFRLGTIKKDYAGNEFTYGAGVASLAAGDWVIFKDELFVPVRLVSTPLTGRVAVACAANTSATNYSWYLRKGNSKQITGLVGAVNLATDGSGDQKVVFQSATPGRGTTATAAATKQILGTLAVGNPSANVGDVIVDNPFCTGNSTI